MEDIRPDLPKMNRRTSKTSKKGKFERGDCKYEIEEMEIKSAQREEETPTVLENVSTLVIGVKV
jgi:hypothetical protein